MTNSLLMDYQSMDVLMGKSFYAISDNDIVCVCVVCACVCAKTEIQFIA